MAKKLTQRQACIEVLRALGQDSHVREHGLKARVIGDIVFHIVPSTSVTQTPEGMTRAACGSLMKQDPDTFKQTEDKRWKLSEW